jgi:SAM-dependent methyltransferase
MTGPTTRITQLRAGVAGLGLLRLYPDGSMERVGEVLDRMAAMLRESAGDLEDPLREREASAGYDEWSPIYDTPNPVTILEDPVLEPLLAAVPIGVAADVACGTGRIALKLAALGHRVIGVDASAAMLAVLESRSTVETRRGNLEKLPIADAELDLLTCTLALTHVPALAPVFVEFARVLKAGGQALLSDIHPLVCATGGQAFYRTAGGERRFVRNRVHLHSEYVAAFVAAGLDVRGCWEPTLGPSVGHLLSPGRELDPELALLAFEGLPGLLIWKVEKGV